jgi:hypothetical protein
MRCFHNSKGKVFARLGDDGVLRKSERQRDRLRVTGGRSHAIDADLLEEAINEGAEVLEIVERTLSAGKRVFRIPLRDIYRYGRRVTLAGISRWTVPLQCCELTRGPEEEWRLTARNEMLQAEVRREEVQGIRLEQQMLFSDQEKDFWRTRLQHET